MEEVFARTKFSKPIYERAAHRLVDSGGGVFSHPVGMAVHDDGNYARGPLKPGHVFSIDPQLRVPEERIYFRYEDVIVITERRLRKLHRLPADRARRDRKAGRAAAACSRHSHCMRRTRTRELKPVAISNSAVTFVGRR